MAASSAWSALSSRISSSRDVGAVSDGDAESVVFPKTSLRLAGGSRQMSDSSGARSGIVSSLSSEGGKEFCLKEMVKPEGVLMGTPSMDLILTVRIWAASSVSAFP